MAWGLRVQERHIGMRTSQLVSLFVLGVAVCGAPFSAGCGSGSTTVNPLAPGDARCGVTAAVSNSSIEATGGTGTLRITTARECRWSVSTGAAWIRFTSELEGQGPAELSFAVDPNRSTDARRLEVVVADQRVAISQKAASCTWKMTPNSVSVAPSGGEVRATLATEDYCSWTLSSRVPWIEIAPAMRGVGPTDISLRISSNGGPERTGSVEFPSGAIVVSQKEAPGASASAPAPAPAPESAPAPAPPPLPPPVPCTFQVAPMMFSDVLFSGSPLEVAVTTQAGCAWSVASDATWVTISSRTDGAGSGRVQLSVAENTGAARSGALVVAGQTVRVNQQSRPAAPPPPPPPPPPAPCTFQAAPTEFNDVLFSGSPLQVDVTTQAGCTWSAVSNATWVTISSGANGTGNGAVQLSVAENTGAARSGTLVIAGQTVTVNQQSRPAQPPPPPPPPAPCTFQVAPTEFNDVPFSGSPLQVDVTTQSGCSWSAASNAAWVTISSGANGTGNGAVQLSVAENTGAARSGTLVIAGQTVTVNQQSRPACAFTISPSSYSPSSTGGSVSVTVTTITGCEWTVTGNPAWVSANPAGRTGSGTTTITVQSNGGAARSATLQIAGRDFAVQQGSAPCTYTAGPTTKTVPAYPTTTREIGITTQAHCPVAAAVNVSWIEIMYAPTFGSGDVGIRIYTNTGDQRSGTVTVTGENFVQTVTVTQEGRK